MDIEEQSWDFTGRHAGMGLLDVEVAMQEWGEVLEVLSGAADTGGC